MALKVTPKPATGARRERDSRSPGLSAPVSPSLPMAGLLPLSGVLRMAGLLPLSGVLPMSGIVALLAIGVLRRAHQLPLSTRASAQYGWQGLSGQRRYG